MLPVDIESDRYQLVLALNTLHLELYQRLKNYDLDDPTHEFGFTRHLIKNHGWTEKYADRAIAEYKKFVFLTVVSDHQIVPSDAVDQVWHAHLLFDPIQRFALYGESTLSGEILDDLKQLYKAQQEKDTGGCGCGC